jgi:hypothetical protein
VSNVLSAEKKQQVIALGRLGWSLRRIERAAHIRRETVGAYLRAAGIAVRPPGGWGHHPSNPAIEVSTDSEAENPPRQPGRSPSVSACEPYREIIEAALAKGRNAMAIWQDPGGRPRLAARDDFCIGKQKFKLRAETCQEWQYPRKGRKPTYRG